RSIGCCLHPPMPAAAAIPAPYSAARWRRGRRSAYSRLAKNRQMACYSPAECHLAPRGEKMADTPGLRSKLHQSWGWLLALGVVLILFGFLILTTPMGVVT